MPVYRIDAGFAPLSSGRIRAAWFVVKKPNDFEA